MTATVWLASYPKSGNTWFRMLVANLSATDEPVDINDLPEPNVIASARSGFEFVTLLDSGLLTHAEAERLRPRVHEELAHGFELDGSTEEVGPGPRLVKVHDAYIATPEDEPLLAGARGAAAAIVIARDPRAIAPSLAHHHQTSVDDAIGVMNNRTAALAAAVASQTDQLRQRLLDWSGHVESWLDQGDVPVHLVRYENLQAAPVETLRAAMAFIGRDVSRAAAERAVDFAGFARLQAQERAKGFGEWRGRREGALFFRSGESQSWRRELSPDQVRRIESAHAPMMARLGYRPEVGETRSDTRIRVGDRR
jgi:aryl sulfotransferase